MSDTDVADHLLFVQQYLHLCMIHNSRWNKRPEMFTVSAVQKSCEDGETSINNVMNKLYSLLFFHYSSEDGGMFGVVVMLQNESWTNLMSPPLFYVMGKNVSVLLGSEKAANSDSVPYFAEMASLIHM